MRAAEVRAIRDCAEMAARASLFRTESRWGLYHHRVDYPQRDDAQWFCHTHLRKDEHGCMTSEKRAVEPYVVPLADDERSGAYEAETRIPRVRRARRSDLSAITLHGTRVSAKAPTLVDRNPKCPIPRTTFFSAAAPR